MNFVYFCPFRDKLYVVDNYAHANNQLHSVDITCDDPPFLQYTFTGWIYIGEL